MLSLIAAAAGAVIGALWNGVFGAALCAGVAWLLVRSLAQQRELDRLREELTATETSLLETRASVARARAAAKAASPASPAAPPATAPAPPPEIGLQPTSPSPDVGTPTAPRLPESTEPPAVRPAAAATTVAASGPPPLRPQEPLPAGPFDTLYRWLLGGNTIVKVGIGILFVGLAFLAKYASERVDVPIEARLGTIGGAAIVLLVIGWRLRERRAGYAQTLQGGAVAILYLTLFAAFRLYGVLGVGPVFLLMVTTAVLAAVLAVLQDAPALAVIGALGGFSTPLLVSTGSGNYVALFSYYLVLDLGIAIVAWHKTWRPLNLVGFLFTFVVGTAWGVLKYADANYASSQAFLAAFFLLFVAVLLMPVRQRRIAPANRADGWVNGTLLFGLPTVTFVLQYGLIRHTDYGVALSALALAVFYVMLAAAMHRHPRLAVVFEGSLAIGSVFVTLTIPFALDARSTAGAWALEGAGLVWLGFRQARALGRAFGYLLLAVAGGLYFGSVVLHSTPDRLVDATLLNGLLVVASSIAAAWVVRTFAEMPGGHTGARRRNRACRRVTPDRMGHDVARVRGGRRDRRVRRLAVPDRCVGRLRERARLASTRASPPGCDGRGSRFRSWVTRRSWSSVCWRPPPCSKAPSRTADGWPGRLRWRPISSRSGSRRRRGHPGRDTLRTHLARSWSPHWVGSKDGRSRRTGGRRGAPGRGSASWRFLPVCCSRCRCR